SLRRRRRREVQDRQRGDPRRTGSPRAVPPAARPAGGLPAPSLGGRAAGPGSSPPAAHARRPRPRPQGHAPMDFSRLFIDRPLVAAVVSIVTVAAGRIPTPPLRIGECAGVVQPWVVLRTVYPGASPKGISEAVATPREEAITGVEDMMYVKSVAGSDGVLELTVTFRPGTDPDDATVKVQNRVSQALAGLPEDGRRQGVATRKQAPASLVAVGLTSE